MSDPLVGRKMKRGFANEFVTPHAGGTSTPRAALPELQRRGRSPAPPRNLSR